MILLQLKPKNVHLTVSLNSENVLHVEIRIFKIKMFISQIHIFVVVIFIGVRRDNIR